MSRRTIERQLVAKIRVAGQQTLVIYGCYCERARSASPCYCLWHNSRKQCPVSQRYTRLCPHGSGISSLARTALETNRTAVTRVRTIEHKVYAATVAVGLISSSLYNDNCVCVRVCVYAREQDHPKTCERICIEFPRSIGYGSGTKGLDFGSVTTGNNPWGVNFEPLYVR